MNGAEACPLYKYLTQFKSKPKGPGRISWIFENFLFDHPSKVVARFEPSTEPDAPEMIKRIEAKLAEK